jgi:hypothetical protein
LETDELVKFLFRVHGDGQVDLSMVADSGWRKYGPGMLYKYITDFLLQMQRLLNESADFDLEEISGDGGHAPYSLNEFHDFLAKEYGRVLTNEDSTQNAVVYHTTVSRRNRNVGWYHVFEYNSHPIATIPDPIQNQPEVEESTRAPPDCFWWDICSTHVNGLRISVAHVLVGKLILTHFPKILQDKISLSPKDIKQLQTKKISNNLTLQYLFPDSRHFHDFVRNCLRSTLKWKLLPFDSNLPDFHELELKKEICSNFQMECSDEGLDQALELNIQEAINERKLPRIISVGSRGMNSDYILFLQSLHLCYKEQCAELCSQGIGSRQASSDIKKQWLNENYEIPDSI